jgi:hypothetical protein
MEKTNQSSNSELLSLYVRKKRVKKGYSLLDKASRYFEANIANEYGYKIIKFIDFKGIRFVVAEKDYFFYIISLIIFVKTMFLIKGDFEDVNSIIDFTKAMSFKHEAVPASLVIYLS